MTNRTEVFMDELTDILNKLGVNSTVHLGSEVNNNDPDIFMIMALTQIGHSTLSDMGVSLYLNELEPVTNTLRAILHCYEHGLPMPDDSEGVDPLEQVLNLGGVPLADQYDIMRDDSCCELWVDLAKLKTFYVDKPSGNLVYYRHDPKKFWESVLSTAKYELKELAKKEGV